MKLVIVGVLFVLGVVLVGVMLDSSAALPWYLKVAMAAPFLIVFFILIDVVRRKKE